MFVDSHCHLNMLDQDLPLILAQAKSQGVSYFLCVGITLTDHADLAKMAENHNNIFISTGLHPNENPGVALQLSQLTEPAAHPKVIAIGETGLDYFRSEGDLTWQRERFKLHIECARQVNKPLIIHTRDAKEDTIEVLRNHNARDVGGVMHCFTEDWETAQKAMDLGFYISFSGIVTFKNATQIQEVAKKIPLDRMLIETDSPYLAPMPHRGKPNVPAYVSHVAEYIAQLRGESVEKIGQETTDNFFRLFPLAQR